MCVVHKRLLTGDSNPPSVYLFTCVHCESVVCVVSMYNRVPNSEDNTQILYKTCIQVSLYFSTISPTFLRGKTHTADHLKA